MKTCIGCKARKDSVCLLGYRTKKAKVDNLSLLVPTGNCPRPTTKTEFHNLLDKVDPDTREHFGLLA